MFQVHDAYAADPLPLTRNNPPRAANPNAAFRVVIEHVVATVFGVAMGHLQQASRGRANVALARQTAMYLAHVGCSISLTETGRLFARDRTTVAHACALIEDRRDDANFDLALQLLERAVAALRHQPTRWP